MKENVVFYKCHECGNLIGLITGNAENLSCCGKQMEGLTANTTDAATEKHLPVYERQGDKIIVKVGEAPHPMEDDHYIMWVAQVTGSSTTRIKLSPNSKCEVTFPYIPNSSIYSYCNKHGLWKTIVK